MLTYLKDYGEGFVALLALFVSLWSFSVQRLHNQKSVTPNLHFDLFHTDNGCAFQWEISNFGVGPAVVKNFTMSFGRSEISFPSVQDLEKGLKSLGLPPAEKYHLFDPGDYVKQGASIVILEFKGNDADQHSESLSRLSGKSSILTSTKSHFM